MKNVSLATLAVLAIAVETALGQSPGGAISISDAPPSGAVGSPVPMAGPSPAMDYTLPPVVGGLVDQDDDDEYALRPPLLFADMEYLLWTTRAAPIGGAAITTSQGAVGRGAIGNPDTSFLLGGDQNFDPNVFSGARLTVGGFIGEDRIYGAEFVLFALGQQTDASNFGSNSIGVPVIARPFTDAVTGASSSLVIATPGFATGNVLVTHSTELWGGEANSLVNLVHSDTFRWDWGSGFRYLDLEERLSIGSRSDLIGTAQSPFFGGTLTAPGFVTISDTIKTHNQFYGGNLGTTMYLQLGRFYTRASAKCGIGTMRQAIETSGLTAGSGPGVSGETATGLMVTSTNRGLFQRDTFAIVPEGNIRFGYVFAWWLTAFVGYDFLYANSVVRPGDQFDNTVNTRNVPLSSTFGQAGGPTRPAVLFKQTDFWAQGLTFGLAVQY